MEFQNPQASSEVKIEIDVAEDMSLDWGAQNSTTGTVYSVGHQWMSNQWHAMLGIWMARPNKA